MPGIKVPWTLAQETVHVVAAEHPTVVPIVLLWDVLGMFNSPAQGELPAMHSPVLIAEVPKHVDPDFIPSVALVGEGV